MADAALDPLAVIRWIGQHSADKCAILCAACEEGRLDLVPFLVQHYGVTAADMRECGCAPLVTACERGDLAAAQLIASSTNLTLDDVARSQALRKACMGAHWAVVDWLRATVGLGAAHMCARDAARGLRSVLTEACYRGDRRAVEHLVLTFGVTRVELGAELYPVIDAACRADWDVDAVAWVLTRFAVTIADLRMATWTLIDICKRGRLELLDWLLAHYPFEKEDACVDDARPLRDACDEGHLAVAQRLADHFGLTAADASAMRHWILRYACRRRDAAMVRWLRERFGIGNGDPRTDYASRLCQAVTEGRWDVAADLASRGAPRE